MKNQKYPKSKIKKGAILYSVDAYTYDDGTSSVDICEWHIRSIMKRRGTQTWYGHINPFADRYNEKYVHLTQKVKDITWVRLSSKIGHYGWAKSIYILYKKKFKTTIDVLPDGLYTTIYSAFKYAIWETNNYIKSIEKEIKEDVDEGFEWESELKDYQKELRLLKSRFTKYKNK